MHPPMITRPPVPVLAVLAGAAVLASVPPMAGCGRSRGAPPAPVPASAIGRLTAIARRGTQRRPTSAVDDSGCARPAQALAALPPRRRAALVLRCFDDLNEAEIAGMLGRGAGTVTGQISRGLARLREAAGGQDEPGPGRTEGAHHR